MLKNRSTILLAIGLALALVTAGGVYLIASGGRAQTAEAQTIQSVPFVVAKTDIPARTVVTPTMLTRTKLPVTAVPATAARDESEVIGQTTLAAIPQGSLFFKPQLVAAGGRTGASISIDPGKVLVAFPTNDPLTTAGLVQVGDRIDLLATVTSGAGDTARRTQTTVQNLEVVDVIGPQGAPKALTFVVDHQVALFLKFLRDNQATVDVVVRSRNEPDAVRTQSVNIQVLQDTFAFK